VRQGSEGEREGSVADIIASRGGASNWEAFELFTNLHSPSLFWFGFVSFLHNFGELWGVFCNCVSEGHCTHVTSPLTDELGDPAAI
jgi:hypothetical protein